MSLSNLFKNFKDIHRNTINKHKEFSSIIKGIEMLPLPVLFTQEFPNYVKFEKNMLERLCNINNHLQELDTKHSTNIQSFQENIKFISKIQKNSKLLKVQLFNL